MIGLYCITNKINGKKYFGQSIDLEKREKQYFNYEVFPNDHLKNSFNKYGKENFEFKIIKVCKEKYLDRLEKLYIRVNDTQNREKGYNKESGGNLNKHHSEETKQKMRENYNGYKTQIKKGQHLSIETEFKKGNKPWNTGKKRPELSKEKHPNWKNYARIVKKGFNSSGKQVYAIAYNGNKRMKTSVDKESLIKWFKENYPNIKLVDRTKEEKQQ